MKKSQTQKKAPTVSKDVVYILTEDYQERALPSIKSLIKNGNIDRIFVLTEGKFKFNLPVESIDISGQKIISPNSPNYRGNRFSWAIMLRAALHRLFPEHSRILSLDADTIVLGDLSPLWELPLDGYYFAGAREPRKSRGGDLEQRELYVNVGVSMSNLEMMRDGTGDRCIDALNTRAFPFVEQDALNEFCEGKILKMDSAFNVCDWVEPMTDVKIMHYAAVQRWDYKPLVQAYRGLE